MELQAPAPMWLLMAPALLIGAAAVSAAVSVSLLPLLRRLAMAHPNARSSHAAPTPQGGGIGITGAIVIVTLSAILIHFASYEATTHSLVVLAAAALLCLVGAVDDIRGLHPLPRLLAQIATVAAAVWTLPPDWQLLPFAPWWLDRLILMIAGVWFVNLVNFMDGIDWMTVSEMVPITATLALLGALGALPPEGAFVALAVCGSVIGFAPFNRPVARLFLGDAGSLVLGFLTGWLLMLLASRGHLTAALLLPLYYVADASVTLLRRLARGERVWEAHRSHFYQRATDRDFTPLQIVSRVFGLNLVLAALALVTIAWPSLLTDVVTLLLGCAAVGALLHRFAAGHGPEAV